MARTSRERSKSVEREWKSCDLYHHHDHDHRLHQSLVSALVVPLAGRKCRGVGARGVYCHISLPFVCGSICWAVRDTHVVFGILWFNSLTVATNHSQNERIKTDPNTMFENCKSHLDILSYLNYLSHSLVDRWGTILDFTTSFLHFSRISAFRSMIFHSRPVHSLMSSHRFLCLPLRLPP